MGYAFSDFGTGSEAVSGKNALLFLLRLTSLWIGCNGASKDIVSEFFIFRRERDINLSTTAFIAVKYAIGFVFTIVRVFIVLLLTALPAEEVPGRLIGQGRIFC